MKVFLEYAQYYDLLNQQKDYIQEVDYIIPLLNKFAPDTKCLLELGCKTGIHAINLVEEWLTGNKSDFNNWYVTFIYKQI